MKNLYPIIDMGGGIKDVINWIIEVTRERNIDLDDFNNQERDNPKIFPVPASSSDLSGAEKAGDISFDTGFFYIVVDNAGTLEWRRVAIVSF